LLKFQRFNKNRWLILKALPLKILDDVSSSGSGVGIGHRGRSLNGTNISNSYEYFKHFFFNPGNVLVPFRIGAKLEFGIFALMLIILYFLHVVGIRITRFDVRPCEDREKSCTQNECQVLTQITTYCVLLHSCVLHAQQNKNITSTMGNRVTLHGCIRVLAIAIHEQHNTSLTYTHKEY
jgi:hypothetical protein